MSSPALPVLIGKLQKNASEEVRVVLDEFKGTSLCDMRVFAAFSAAGVPMPTKKGLSVRVDMLGELIETLTAAKAEAERIGWLGGGD